MTSKLKKYILERSECKTDWEEASKEWIPYYDYTDENFNDDNHIKIKCVCGRNIKEIWAIVNEKNNKKIKNIGNNCITNFGGIISEKAETIKRAYDSLSKTILDHGIYIKHTFSNAFNNGYLGTDLKGETHKKYMKYIHDRNNIKTTVRFLGHTNTEQNESFITKFEYDYVIKAFEKIVESKDYKKYTVFDIDKNSILYKILLTKYDPEQLNKLLKHPFELLFLTELYIDSNLQNKPFMQSTIGQVFEKGLLYTEPDYISYMLLPENIMRAGILIADKYVINDVLQLEYDSIYFKLLLKIESAENILDTLNSYILQGAYIGRSYKALCQDIETVSEIIKSNKPEHKWAINYFKFYFSYF